MNAINYSRVFSNLCYIKALSHDNKFDEIVQHLILNVMCKGAQGQLSKGKEVVEKINDIYGILLREHVVQSNLDKLISVGKIKQIERVLYIDKREAEKILKNIQDITNLDVEVKNDWFFQIKNEFVDYSDEKLEVLWEALQNILARCSNSMGYKH